MHRALAHHHVPAPGEPEPEREHLGLATQRCVVHLLLALDRVHGARGACAGFAHAIHFRAELQQHGVRLGRRGLLREVVDARAALGQLAVVQQGDVRVGQLLGLFRESGLVLPGRVHRAPGFHRGQAPAFAVAELHPPTRARRRGILELGQRLLRRVQRRRQRREHAHPAARPVQDDQRPRVARKRSHRKQSLGGREQAHVHAVARDARRAVRRRHRHVVTVHVDRIALWHEHLAIQAAQLADAHHHRAVEGEGAREVRAGSGAQHRSRDGS
jgi:hypothetical protein